MPAPPPPSGFDDEITRTARQVRIDTRRDDLPVHRLFVASTRPHIGAVYRTRCNKVLAKFDGAILTTREATCEPCARGGAA
jgi:hypothetical protein